MENFDYINIESKSMRESLRKHGNIKVFLSEKKYSLFYRFTNKLDKLLLEKSNLSKLLAAISFLAGMLSLLRILVFHTKLIGLISFYYLTNPMLSTKKSVGDSDVVELFFSKASRPTDR